MKRLAALGLQRFAVLNIKRSAALVIQRFAALVVKRFAALSMKRFAALVVKRFAALVVKGFAFRCAVVVVVVYKAHLLQAPMRRSLPRPAGHGRGAEATRTIGAPTGSLSRTARPRHLMKETIPCELSFISAVRRSSCEAVRRSSHADNCYCC